MAKVSRNRRQSVPQDTPQEASMWDLPNQEEPAAQEESADKPDVTTEALLKQIAELQARVETSERAQLASIQQLDTTVAPQPPKPFTIEGLPDPIENPTGYATELNARIQRGFEEKQAYEKAQGQQQQASSNKSKDLWEDFNISYPDYAEDEEGVEFVARKVLRDAQKRGIDPDRYMFQHRDRFMKDLVTAYDDRFGKPEGEEEPKPRRQAANVTLGEDQGRTGGIFGGLDSGNRPAPAPAGGSDMIKDLQKMQRDTGFW